MPPIKPSEVNNKEIPEIVFDSFNELINEKFADGSATVKQAEVVIRMLVKGLSREDIFEKKWLDIEEHYRAAGWKVKYDKPGFNESGEAYFEFISKTKRE